MTEGLDGRKRKPPVAGMSLIHQLSKEHEALRKALEEIRALRISSDEGRELLWKTRGLLEAHLEREDRLLYPALQALEASKVLADSFQDDMRQISVRVGTFFQTYGEGITDANQFARDFGELRAVLSHRMIREETRLYPAYAEHVEPAQAPDDSV